MSPANETTNGSPATAGAGQASKPEKPELLSVGWITKPHGLKGDVIVFLSTNRTERMRVGAVFHSARGPIKVASCSPHQDRWRVRFEGCSDRNGSEALQGLELKAEPIHDPEALWFHELIGSTVRLVDGTVVGTVASLASNPASDLLVLDSGGLVPLVFVVSNGDGVVVVDPPLGLLDESEQYEAR